MEITNTGPAPRVIPIGGKYVELAPGVPTEVDDKAWAALRKRPTMAARIEAGLIVEGSGEKKSRAKPKADDGKKIDDGLEL